MRGAIFFASLLLSATAVFDKSVLTFTRFNCAFPFCPTTALDVCAIDEHYELGRPHVIATLIEQTTTADMIFFAYSAFDNSTRTHFTLAPRQINGDAVNQLFTVSIAMNGTAGALVATSEVVFPAGAAQADISYVFTYGGLVYVAFKTGTLLAVAPSTGAIASSRTYLPPGMAGSLACSFDSSTATFWANAAGAEGFYLTSTSVTTNATTTIGPLPPTPGTGAGPNNAREDAAIAQLIVRPPPANATANDADALRILELRTSPLFPFLFFAFIDPVTGASTQVPFPDEWYQDWDIDPNVFPDQWPGSLRRVWDFDRENQRGWFKLYDECGGVDDCDENESIVYFTTNPASEVFFYVAVEPVEPELTQLIWTPTNIIE
jgi:hypothetical protein